MEPAWTPDAYVWNGYTLAARPLELLDDAEDAEATAGLMLALGVEDALPAAPATTHTKAGAIANNKHLAVKVSRGMKKDTCQVVGCTSDLTHSRAYYRRYHICEQHFRASYMVLNGTISRFCQQCAKFEAIVEFEADKRSCRRQLMRHNERRKGHKKAKKAQATGVATRTAGGTSAGGLGEDNNSGDSSCPTNKLQPALQPLALGAGGWQRSDRLSCKLPAAQRSQRTAAVPDGGAEGMLVEQLQSSSIQRSSHDVDHACTMPAHPPGLALTHTDAGEQQPAKQKQPPQAPFAGHPLAFAADPPPNTGEARSRRHQLLHQSQDHAMGSPPASVSEVTVEVGPQQQHQAYVAGGGAHARALSVHVEDDGLDAALLATVANELTAHLAQVPSLNATRSSGEAAGSTVHHHGHGQQHRNNNANNANANNSNDDNTNANNNDDKNDNNANHAALVAARQLLMGAAGKQASGVSAGRAASEPPSADSSVHGPCAMQHMVAAAADTACCTADGGGVGNSEMERILLLLGQNARFDAVRADGEPLVRDVLAAARPAAPVAVAAAAAGGDAYGSLPNSNTGGQGTPTYAAHTGATAPRGPSPPFIAAPASGQQQQQQQQQQASFGAPLPLLQCPPLPPMQPSTMVPAAQLPPVVTALGAFAAAEPPPQQQQQSALLFHGRSDGHTLATALQALPGLDPGSSALASGDMLAWLAHEWRNALAAGPDLLGGDGGRDAVAHEAPVPEDWQAALGGATHPQHAAIASAEAAGGADASHLQSAPSAHSLTPAPQALLHPLLVNLPRLDDCLLASAAKPTPIMATAAGKVQPSLCASHPDHTTTATTKMHYPNIWTTTVPDIMPAPPLHELQQPRLNQRDGGGSMAQGSQQSDFLSGHLAHGSALGGAMYSGNLNNMYSSFQLGAQHQQAGLASSLARLPSQSTCHAQPMAVEPLGQAASSSLQALARNLSQANYLLAELSLTRLSIKLHGVTPDALPGDLRQALTDWLAATDVRLLQGFIRPGCVHLSLDCYGPLDGKQGGGGSSSSQAVGSLGSVAAPAAAASMAIAASGCGAVVRGLDGLLQAGLAMAGVAHMVSVLPAPLARLFSSCTIVELQLPNKLVLMEGEAVWSVVPLDKWPNTPHIELVQPLALLAGSNLPQAVYVHGAHLEGRATASSSGADASCQLLVRGHGRFWQQGAAVPVPLAVHEGPAGPGSCSGTASALSWWRVSVDMAGMPPGLAVVECQNGRKLSNWRPVLVVDDPGVHHEVLQLQPLQVQFPERVQTVVMDLALLVQLGSVEQQRQHQHKVEMERHRLQLLQSRWRSPLHLPRHVDVGMYDEEEGDDEGSEVDLSNDDHDSLTAPSISSDETEAAYGDDKLKCKGQEGAAPEHGGPAECEEGRGGQLEAGGASAAGSGTGGNRCSHSGMHALAAAALVVAPRAPGGARGKVPWCSETLTELGEHMQVHSSIGSTASRSSLAQAVASSDMDVAMAHAGGSGHSSSQLSRLLAGGAVAPARPSGNSSSGVGRIAGAQMGCLAQKGGAGAAAAPPLGVPRGVPAKAAAPARQAGASGAVASWEQASEAFTPEMRGSMAQRALRLLAFACDAGWPCTTRLLLDLLTTTPLLPPPHLAGMPLQLVTTAQLVPLSPHAVMVSAAGGDGLTPLHRATRSGSADTVREVLNFARGATLPLNPAAHAGASASALHLAAATVAGGPAAVALLQSAHDAPVQWFVARDEKGRTPAQLAARSGCRHVNELARMMVQQLAQQ